MGSSLVSNVQVGRTYKRVRDGETLTSGLMPEPRTPNLIPLDAWATFGDRDFPELCEAARQVQTVLKLRRDHGCQPTARVVNFVQGDHAASGGEG
ncbi:hypothetical protein METEAL_15210 [Mesoterricola silvestris]|uniref:Uncharacterized protein n=1 Tax=Mesoterricola silvestris TaxID=2927979 RepID=A0AA48GQV4_9BACT|nr:hypothetical protein METEAL_15210 [Mesoterricola silvestris]